VKSYFLISFLLAHHFFYFTHRCQCCFSLSTLLSGSMWARLIEKGGHVFPLTNQIWAIFESGKSVSYLNQLHPRSPDEADFLFSFSIRPLIDNSSGNFFPNITSLLVWQWWRGAMLHWLECSSETVGLKVESGIVYSSYVASCGNSLLKQYFMHKMTQII